MKKLIIASLVVAALGTGSAFGTGTPLGTASIIWQPSGTASNLVPVNVTLEFTLNTPSTGIAATPTTPVAPKNFTLGTGNKYIIHHLSKYKNIQITLTSKSHPDPIVLCYVPTGTSKNAKITLPDLSETTPVLATAGLSLGNCP